MNSDLPDLPARSNNLPGQSPERSPSPRVTALVALLPINFLCGPQPALFHRASGYIEPLRITLDKNKQRAVSILLFFGTILVLMATWDLPEDHPPQMK